MNLKLSTLTALLLLAVAVTAAAGPQARVLGTVVDTSGEPIPGAEVRITTEEIPDFEKVVEADDDGEWRALILDATKSYMFTVTAPGYIEHREPFKVPAGTTDNEFTFALKTEEEVRQEQRQDLLDQPGYRELAAGQELLKAGDYAGARAQFELAVEKRPDLLPAWSALVEATSRAGDTEAALRYSEECLKLDDESLECLAVAANACKKLGDTGAHERYMARYRELNPDDPASLFNEAVEHLNAMDDAAARPLLEQCLEVDPDFARCLYEYGMLLLRSGDLEGAKRHLEHYLEVAPEGEDAATVRETVKYL